MGKGGRRAGFTLIEVMLAMAIVAFALLGLVSLITSSSRVQDESSSRTRAYNAVRKVIEEMRGLPLADVYPTYRSGGTIGDTFAVDEIPKNPAGVNGAQGRILFPEAGGGLTESPADAILAAELGMPKDLNRDGDVVDTGLSTYAILPVKIVVEWAQPGGKLSKVEVVTFIAER